MAEDTGWLKKNPVGNPFRMSLRRSNRFYAQDMDGSIMANEDKSKNQVLVVSHMPRRSNIPIEKIKQMDFKIPAPVLKKSGIKKPVTRMPKFSLGQPASRTSVYAKHTPHKNRAELRNQSSKNINLRSNMNRPSQANGCILSVPKLKTPSKVPETTESSSQMSMHNSANLSILTQSKIVNQSTPKDPAILRTILKRNQGTGICGSPGLLSSKKSKAAKRVNFNCVAIESNEEGVLKSEESFLPLGLGAAVKKDLLCETDEESIVAFSNSFKPIMYEEVGSDKDEDVVKVKVEACRENVKNKDSEITDSDRVIGNIINMWGAYRNKLNDIWTQLQANDEGFKNNLKVVLENGLQDKFSAYEVEKCRLYDELRTLEEEFRNQMRSKVDLKTSFLGYFEKKVSIYKAKSELDDYFEKSLSTIADIYLGKDRETKKGKENDEERSARKSITRKKLSQGKVKSGCLNSSKVKTASVKRAAKHKISCSGSTPDNTPARRRKLSRKIEEQIRTLFED